MPPAYFSDSEDTTTAGSSPLPSGFTTPRPGSPISRTTPLPRSLPQTIQPPLTLTKQTVRAHFADIKEAALLYDLKLPHFCQFLLNCCNDSETLKRFATLCVDDLELVGELRWDVFDFTVEEMTAVLPTTADWLLWRMRAVFNLSRLDDADHCPMDWNWLLPRSLNGGNWPFNTWFKRLLLLMEEEVKKDPKSNVIPDHLYAIITAFYEKKFKESRLSKPDMGSYIAYPSTSLTPIVRFQELRATLLSNYETINSMLKGEVRSSFPNAPVLTRHDDGYYGYGSGAAGGSRNWW